MHSVLGYFTTYTEWDHESIVDPEAIQGSMEMLGMGSWDPMQPGGLCIRSIQECYGPVGPVVLLGHY